MFSNRDRPTAIPVDVKSIDDTSNFDDFPEVNLAWSKIHVSYLILIHLESLHIPIF